MHKRLMQKALRHLATSREGATAIEYGMLAGLIALGIVASVTTIGTDLTQVFTTASAAISH